MWKDRTNSRQQARQTTNLEKLRQVCTTMYQGPLWITWMATDSGKKDKNKQSYFSTTYQKQLLRPYLESNTVYCLGYYK